jgi:hypothetical protein
MSLFPYTMLLLATIALLSVPLTLCLLYRMEGTILVCVMFIWRLSRMYTIPSTMVASVQSYIREKHPVDYIGEVPVFDGEDKNQIILLFPHGMFCLEPACAIVDLLHRMKRSSTPIRSDQAGLCVDRNMVYFPFFHWLAGMFGVTTIVPLCHKDIMAELRRPTSDLFVFPGGFVEAFGYTDSYQVLYMKTVSYWLKQCQTSGRDLRIVHVYNGSDMVIQCGLWLRIRAWIAGRFHIPLVLPRGIRATRRFVARTWRYKSQELPTDVQQIQTDMRMFIDLDKTHDLFPARDRTYEIIDMF